MTETRNELFERGWRPGASIDGSLTSFLADLDIVYDMRCSRCENPSPKGGLRLETWRKAGQPDKSFTVCRRCGLRKPF